MILNFFNGVLLVITSLIFFLGILGTAILTPLGSSADTAPLCYINLGTSPRACLQFYYVGRILLIFCGPKLTYHQVCEAQVLKNQQPTPQPSEL